MIQKQFLCLIHPMFIGKVQQVFSSGDNRYSAGFADMFVGHFFFEQVAVERLWFAALLAFD